MWPGMKILAAVVCLPLAALLLASATPTTSPEASLPGFGKSLASEMDVPGAGARDLVHADEAGKLWAMQAGTKKRALGSELNHEGFTVTAAARGLGDDGATLRWEWLATLSRDAQAGLSVLSIHDTEGRLALEEVLLESCSRLAWHAGDAPELLVGCADHVWRYRPGPSSAPMLTPAQFAHAGSAFGPLSFGDATPRVRSALQLAGGVCQDEHCTTMRVRVGERDFTLLPQFQNGALARLTVFGPRRPRAAWRTKVKDDWEALVTEVTRETAATDAPYPSATSLTAVPETEGVFFTETHRPARDGAKATIGLFRNETGNARGFGAIAVITPPAAPVAVAPAAPTLPVPAAAAD